MAAVQNFPFAVIMLYLTGGVICFVLPARGAARYCLALNAAAAALMAPTLAYTARTGSSYVYWMGHFGAPWGNELRVGPLEALLALCFCLVMLLTLMGGMEHVFEDCEEGKRNLYFGSVSLLMSSIVAIIFTNDLFSAYVFIEISSITACAVIAVNYRNGAALVATTRYMIMSLLGSGVFLIGIAMLYDLTGHLLMENLSAAVRGLLPQGGAVFPLTIIIGLFSVGMGIKSALFPFHTWLPGAHGNATAASSGMLSGLVLKANVFLLIKIFCRVFGLEFIAGSHVNDVLLVFGGCAMVFGSLAALAERDLKRMLAYSSVAQIGYIYLGIGMGSRAGLEAACIQILVHAMTKPMLFCAAGGFMGVSGGSKKMEALRGAARRDTLSGAAFFVGALSMIGIPLFAGFATKLNLLLAALEPGNWKTWLSVAAIVLSTVLNALYYLRAVAQLYAGPGEGGADAVPVQASHTWPFVVSMCAFMALNLYMGICPERFMDAIHLGLELFG